NPVAEDLDIVTAQRNAQRGVRPSRPPDVRQLLARRKDGRTFPVELHVADALPDRNARFVAFIRDLSERRTRDEQAEKLHSELAYASRLMNIGDMASALAHELNQPLTALAAYLQGAELLLAQNGDNKCALAIGALKKATAQALRAGDVIRRLREFVSRGET